MGRTAAETIELSSPSYTPGRLLDKVSRSKGLRNDNRLSALLGCDPALISRVRNRKDQLSHWLMVRIMDVTDWSIKEVRELAGIPFNGGVVDPYYAQWMERMQETTLRRQEKLLR